MPSTGEKKGGTGSRGPYRMDDRLKVIKALKEMGATRCEVDGVKVEFPAEPGKFYLGSTEDPKRPITALVPPNLEYLAKSSDFSDDSSKPPPPAIRGNPDPDEYSRASDMWANYEPSPLRG